MVDYTHQEHGGIQNYSTLNVKQSSSAADKLSRSGSFKPSDLILPRVYAEDPWASSEKGRGT